MLPFCDQVKVTHMGNGSPVNSMNQARQSAKHPCSESGAWRRRQILRRIANIKGVAGYSYMYRDTLTHSTLLTCTRSGAAKSTPTVNGTGGPKTVSHRDQNTVVFSTFFEDFWVSERKRVLKWNFGSFW